MSDVVVDPGALRSAGIDIRGAARTLPATGEPDRLSEDALGWFEVASVLEQVRSELALRAVAASEGLLSAGAIPVATADDFAALDRSMVAGP